MQQRFISLFSLGRTQAIFLLLPYLTGHMLKMNIQNPGKGQNQITCGDSFLNNDKDNIKEWGIMYL